MGQTGLLDGRLQRRSFPAGGRCIAAENKVQAIILRADLARQTENTPNPLFRVEGGRLAHDNRILGKLPFTALGGHFFICYGSHAYRVVDHLTLGAAVRRQ